MTLPETDKLPHCGGDCSHCTLDEDEGADGGLPPRRIAVPAAVTFLVPLALGAVGSAMAGEGKTAQLIGALGGLAVGVAVAVIYGRLTAGSGKEGA